MRSYLCREPRGEPAPRVPEDKIYVRTFVFVRVVKQGAAGRRTTHLHSLLLRYLTKYRERLLSILSHPLQFLQRVGGKIRLVLKFHAYIHTST